MGDSGKALVVMDARRTPLGRRLPSCLVVTPSNGRLQPCYIVDSLVMDGFNRRGLSRG
jgi:hypothetical protein